jgi:1,4-dihydroxy-2-naphthoate octaprenyltransferase
MVGGVYYAATGTIPAAVLLASLPYAILCTTVLMGKHIDKAPWDGPAGTHTLPVILGDHAARQVTRAMFVVFYALVGAYVATGILPVATLLVLASVPLLVQVWRVYGHPKPAESPVPNPVWPLWFAPNAFLLTRRAGGLLLLGLVVGAAVGW